eukprot:7849_1
MVDEKFLYFQILFATVAIPLCGGFVLIGVRRRTMRREHFHKQYRPGRTWFIRSGTIATFMYLILAIDPFGQWMILPHIIRTVLQVEASSAIMTNFLRTVLASEEWVCALRKEEFPKRVRKCIGILATGSVVFVNMSALVAHQTRLDMYRKAIHAWWAVLAAVCALSLTRAVIRIARTLTSTHECLPNRIWPLCKVILAAFLALAMSLVTGYERLYPLHMDSKLYDIDLQSQNYHEDLSPILCNLAVLIITLHYSWVPPVVKDMPVAKTVKTSLSNEKFQNNRSYQYKLGNLEMRETNRLDSLGSLGDTPTPPASVLTQTRCATPDNSKDEITLDRVEFSISDESE